MIYIGIGWVHSFMESPHQIGYFLCKQNRTFELGKTGEMSITDSGFTLSLSLSFSLFSTHLLCRECIPYR